MGLRAVTLGHAYPPVVEAVRASLTLGTNFTRPAPIEVDCAEAFLGPDRRRGDGEVHQGRIDGRPRPRVKLARAHTGRDLVAICARPSVLLVRRLVHRHDHDGRRASRRRSRDADAQFRYNDLASVRALVRRSTPDRSPAVMLEPATHRGAGARASCRAADAVPRRRRAADLRRDDHRLPLAPAAARRACTASSRTSPPSARRIGQRVRASRRWPASERSCSSAAATRAGAACSCSPPPTAPRRMRWRRRSRTMDVYRSEPVVEHLHRQGARLADGRARRQRAATGSSRHVEVVGRPCNLFFGTRDAEARRRSRSARCSCRRLIRRGVLAPSFVVSYSHTRRGHRPDDRRGRRRARRLCPGALRRSGEVPGGPPLAHGLRSPLTGSPPSIQGREQPVAGQQVGGGA